MQKQKYLAILAPIIGGFVIWKLTGILEFGLFFMTAGLILNSYLMFIKRNK